MKLKCKARRYLSLFSCNSEIISHMTNYLNFKLSTDVEKKPGPAQSNTDSHETIIKPVMQSDSSVMQLVSRMILILISVQFRFVKLIPTRFMPRGTLIFKCLRNSISFLQIFPVNC